jgi:hypothetical protein
MSPLTAPAVKRVFQKGRIVSARVPDRHGRRRAVAADLFVCALPVERARQLWTPRILNADPRLEGMNRIQTVWANGIQFYLRREVAVVRGHYFCIDSPWGVSSISHAQFWTSSTAGRRA